VAVTAGRARWLAAVATLRWKYMLLVSRLLVVLPAGPLALTDEDRTGLGRLLRSGSPRLAQRAKMVLACADPAAGTPGTSAPLGITAGTMRKWRARFTEAGLDGLADHPRPGRPKARLELTSREQRQLTQWARRPTSTQAQAQRAKIVLACAQGQTNKQAAAQLQVTEATVARWRRRFIQLRCDGLADQPRPGRPSSIPPGKVAEVVTATQQEAPQGTARWSRASMAQHSGLSKSTIGRIWRTSGLKPHLAGASENSADEPSSAHVKFTSNISGAPVSGNTPPASQIRLAHDQPKPGGNVMLAAERRDLLVARLARDGKLVARDLAAEFGLSDDSVRRDLRDLAAAGICHRVYGGALPASPLVTPGRTNRLDFVSFSRRSGMAAESKERIGARAAQLITPGSTVILDGGTTAMEVVAALPPDLDATIITRSATTAAALLAHPTADVFMLGGQLHKPTVNTLGVVAAEAAFGITADLALLSITGIHPLLGLTQPDPDEAALTRILMSRAESTYVMASIEKLGTACAYTISGLSDVAGIVTDAPADHPTVRELRGQGARIIQAG
jgi:DeoR/GlpR family transcriptional regulator of sugar metabolism/transposase